MSLQVDIVDRITNLTPATSSDKTLLNADNVMLMLDNILDGDYRQKLKGGTEVNKPAVPEDREVYLVSEANYWAYEVYSSTFGWLILKGVWNTTSDRPSTSGLAPGSEGFNINTAQKEFWDGSTWRAA